MPSPQTLNAQQKLDLLPHDKRQRIEIFIQKCKNPIWRLNNLYKIKDKNAQVIPFHPNPQQSIIFDAVYNQGIKRIIILKARQLGFSTAIALMLFDAIYWGKNINAAIVDRTQPDAHKKLNEKAKFAHELLPHHIKRQPLISNESQLAFGKPHNASSLIAGKNIRGGTYNWVHISEAGPIAHEDPSRYREIQTGVFPAAENGTIIIETTMEGGKTGELYRLIKNAQEIPPEDRTKHDWHVFFFPWYSDPGYSLNAHHSLTPPHIIDYFQQKQQETGHHFSQEQMLWYAKKKAEQGIYILREYPTTIEEAFAAPVEGSIYGDLISKIRDKGQIHDFIPDPAHPIFSAWDIGWNDQTSIWMFQIIGRDIHFVHHISQRQLTAAQAWQLVQQTKLHVHSCFLPHDAANTSASNGLSYQTALQNAGALDVRILPQSRDIWAGINATRDIIPRSFFHKTNCHAGIQSLEAYHTKTLLSGSAITKEPVHDHSSHDADALRYAASAIFLGLIKTHSAKRITNNLDKIAAANGLADLHTIRQQRRTNRSQTAISGHVII